MNEEILIAVLDIAKYLIIFPRCWDGKKAILEMKNANFPHWRQMEWVGFYFQFLCEKKLYRCLTIPGPRFKKVEFDGLKVIPWDFKAHDNNRGRVIICNDWKATEKAIEKYGAVGIILATGEAEYDNERREFQNWHTQLIGGPSPYTLERVARGAPSRLRKVLFRLRNINFIIISNLENHNVHHQGRNADGRRREPKVEIDLDTARDAGEIWLTIEYQV